MSKEKTFLAGSLERSKIMDAEQDRARIKGISLAEGEDARSLLFLSCRLRSFLPVFGDNLSIEGKI